MTHVATLISDPLTCAVTPTLVARALAALPVPADVAILDPTVAVDLVFTAPSGVSTTALADLIRGALGAPVDVVVQGLAHRRKRLFLADMDSTMIGQECIDELADRVGLKAHVAAITERAMRGEIAFEPALRERVALLKGLALSVVDDVLRDRIVLTPGGRTLVATMRANGAYTALVSGGFTAFTGPIASAIGFHEHRSNVLLVDDGRLTGAVAEPILGQNAKREALVALRAAYGVDPRETLAVGDGANDLAMIGEAGLGVAFRAKPKVAAAAEARIDHGDLTALLYAQGYKREDFVIPA